MPGKGVNSGAAGAGGVIGAVVERTAVNSSVERAATLLRLEVEPLTRIQQRGQHENYRNKYEGLTCSFWLEHNTLSFTLYPMIDFVI